MLSAPYTWAVGEQATSPKFNQHFRDNIQEIWQELAYVEFNADVVVNGTEAAPNDVVSAGAITFTGRPIVVEFFAPALEAGNANGANVYLNLWDSATDLGRLAQHLGTTGNTTSEPVFVTRRFTPTAASHTYKIRAWYQNVGGAVRAGAGGVGVRLPGYIRILQKGA